MQGRPSCLAGASCGWPLVATRPRLSQSRPPNEVGRRGFADGPSSPQKPAYPPRLATDARRNRGLWGDPFYDESMLGPLCRRSGRSGSRREDPPIDHRDRPTCRPGINNPQTQRASGAYHRGIRRGLCGVSPGRYFEGRQGRNSVPAKGLRRPRRIPQEFWEDQPGRLLLTRDGGARGALNRARSGSGGGVFPRGAPRQAARRGGARRPSATSSASGRQRASTTASCWPGIAARATRPRSRRW